MGRPAAGGAGGSGGRRRRRRQPGLLIAVTPAPCALLGHLFQLKQLLLSVPASCPPWPLPPGAASRRRTCPTAAQPSPAFSNPARLPYQARKLESELDIKVAAYGKLCSSYEYGYSKGESGLATDQVRWLGAGCRHCCASATLPTALGCAAALRGCVAASPGRVQAAASVLQAASHAASCLVTGLSMLWCARLAAAAGGQSGGDRKAAGPAVRPE